MSAKRTPALTRIEQRRREAGLSQEDLAAKARISVRTLQRLEHRDLTNPPIRYLANLAIVLECELEDIIEPAWREWADLDWGGRHS
jgi:transcriptional regulator with XRE-family HTH domain